MKTGGRKSQGLLGNELPVVTGDTTGTRGGNVPRETRQERQAGQHGTSNGGQEGQGSWEQKLRGQV